MVQFLPLRMIDQELLRIDVESFCAAYSYKEAMTYDKKFERALALSVADNSREYNTTFLHEIYKCFKAMHANQMISCHGKGCRACDYYQSSISTISQFQTAF